MRTDRESHGSDSPPPPPLPPDTALTSEESTIIALASLLAVTLLALAIVVAVFVYKMKKRAQPPVGAIAANPVAAVNVEMPTTSSPVAGKLMRGLSTKKSSWLGAGSSGPEEQANAGTVGKNPVLVKLEELELEQYAAALMDDQGYDTIASLQGLARAEAGAIADELKMKPGHKKRFVDGFA